MVQAGHQVVLQVVQVVKGFLVQVLDLDMGMVLLSVHSVRVVQMVVHLVAPGKKVQKAGLMVVQVVQKVVLLHQVDQLVSQVQGHSSVSKRVVLMVVQKVVRMEVLKVVQMVYQVVQVDEPSAYLLVVPFVVVVRHLGVVGPSLVDALA